MKIIFVYPNINTGNGLHYALGLGSLAAFCRQQGHEVDLLILNQPAQKESLEKEIAKSNPNFICFSFSTHQWPHVKKLAEWASSTKIPIIAGGVHATFAADKVIADPNIDFVIRGEGEGALVDLLEGIPPEKIPNLTSKDFQNDLRPLIDDLDSLPIYGRADFPMDEILRVNGYELTLMAGRGCPWPCTYCCNRAWQRLYKDKGPYIRLRSHDHLFSEIDLLASKYRVDSLYFEDDIFTLNKNWCETFCREYAKRFDLPFRVYLKVGNVDRDTLKMLHQAGLRHANIGIESGSERVRKEILKRNMTDEQIAELFRWCKEFGIKTRAFNIIGFPGETEEEMDQTLVLNEEVLPDQVQVSMFHPYPGTDLHNQCIEQKIYSGDIRDTYFSDESVLNLPSISKDNMKNKFNTFCETAKQIEAKAFEQRLMAACKKPGNLLPLFDSAMIEAQGEKPVSLVEVSIKKETRFCISAHPRSRIAFSVFTAGRTRFVVDLALDPLCLEWGGGAVIFTVAMRDSNTEQIVAQKRIDPKNNQEDLGWNRWSILLPNAKAVDLILMTEPDADGDLTGAWALWGEPRLESSS